MCRHFNSGAPSELLGSIRLWQCLQIIKTAYSKQRTADSFEQGAFQTVSCQLFAVGCCSNVMRHTHGFAAQGFFLPLIESQSAA